MVTIPRFISDIIYLETERDYGWLARLVWDILESTRARKLVVVFLPEDYGIDLFSPRGAVISFDEITLPVIPNLEDLAGWRNILTSVVTDILEIWLDFPTDGDSKSRAIYALNIIRTAGSEFLNLDCVWKTYQQAKPSLVSNCVVSQDLDVARYPVLNPSSQLRKEVERIARIVDDYTSGRLYRYSDVSDQNTPLINYASEELKLATERRALDFKRFIRSAFTFFYRRETLENLKLQSLYLKNADKYSPFREYAPTRRNMVADKFNSPFFPPHLHTVEGVFSAIICRAVTFGTPLAREGRTVFYGPADFREAVAGMELTQYCDKGAYGQDNHRRNPDEVETYWNQLQTTAWPGINPKKQLSFLACYEYFFVPGAKTVRFPGLGRLGSYLLTADYVYAGLVENPSSAVLGQLIHDLYKGPARALEYLGLVPLRPSGKMTEHVKTTRHGQYKTGLELAFRLVQESIPSEYHSHAGLDLLLTEHGLCKFMRAKKECNISE